LPYVLQSIAEKPCSVIGLPLPYHRGHNVENTTFNMHQKNFLHQDATNCIFRVNYRSADGYIYNMIWLATTLCKMSIGQESQMYQQMAYLSTSIFSEENEKQIHTWPIK
jgi:HD superfamily phosphohydrolase YqeK